MKSFKIALLVIMFAGSLFAEDLFEVKWQYSVGGLDEVQFSYSYSYTPGGGYDYDGDGYADLVFYYLLKADQKYQTRIISGATHEPIFPAINSLGTTSVSQAIDLDQDGTPDFLLSNFVYNSDLRIYEGAVQVRSGTDGKVKWSVNISSITYPSVSFADFDRDGRPEFFFTTATANSATVYVYGQVGEVGVRNARGETPHPTRMDMRAFPNPFNSNTFIEFEVVRDGTVEITLFDTNGRMIAHRKMDNLKTGTMQVPLSSLSPAFLPSGAYFVDVSQDGSGTTRQIVKLP